MRTRPDLSPFQHTKRTYQTKFQYFKSNIYVPGINILAKIHFITKSKFTLNR